ncbi:DUF7344 domain-containing protein [Halalkalicoccus jeotgali]|uniref:DUF7344 domain-containing protein n=1 Tax=Halalkalicoccus jeotgali (strain DSM 18796 / CECT 7217 / JCM 14584 / KCTC 4019 / B3) TaxID=795797 RepID=D8JCY8_HALJB|nr:hypothetical protein HacjB3_17703 [Halalkalicoccus jeotgali B3]ELY38681.1 hypothetical protein C497_07064 [Halalkalicoccus jeotgali B3]
MTSSSPPSDSAVLSPLSLDTVLELLANQRRRFALYSLLTADGSSVEFEPLIEDVATLEAALTEDALTRERYQDVAADLYQWHLPVLDDVGIIDYDPRQDLIRVFEDSCLRKWTLRVQQDEFL